MKPPTRSLARWNAPLAALLTVMSILLITLPLLVVVGSYFPGVADLGRYARILNSNPIWVPAGAAVSCLLTGWALRLGGRRWPAAVLVISALTTAGAIGIAVQLFSVAAQYGASFDPFRVTSAASVPAPDRMTFASVDGQELRAEFWQPDPAAPNIGTHGRVGVVFVHGGSFVAGGLGSRPALFGALADHGFVVVDIEYRLAPPPRWEDAPSDVLCALAWLSTAAADRGIDPGRLVLVGQSAGGNLALLSGYAAGTGVLRASCSGRPIVPAAVIAISPVVDLQAGWEEDFPADDGHRFPETYVGGIPAQLPDRYARASPFWLVRVDTPPTLFLTGNIDPVVRIGQVRGLVDAMHRAAARATLIVLPFADHGFDGPADSFGQQFEESVIPAFILRAVSPTGEG